MIAAIYARKSTEQTGVADEQKSVTRQIDHARQYAARKGWDVADAYIYVDDGISGAEFANRPGFLRLMNAVKPRPPFQVLVMSEVSRLGREQIETAYALKQLSVAGVRCFSYLEDRELLIESATDKFLLGAVTFAADLEREKARQRTSDAMVRKARAGHVCGGAVFGYTNIEVRTPSGARSHVLRQIDEAHAAVVREIFEQYAAGAGIRRIAKRMNEAGRLCPRAQQGRPVSWAPSTVWEVLHRDMYHGELVWNRTKKRNQWGAKAQTNRAEQDWIRVPAPELRIVPEALWQAVRHRAAAARETYLKATGGATWGRPADGRESKYLLTGFLQCSQCGGNLLVRSRSHGAERAYFYACSSYHRRGRGACANNLEEPVERGDDSILTDVERFVLHPKVVNRAIALALEALQPSGDRREQDRARRARELKQAETELGHLTRAIAAGGDMPMLLAAMRAADDRRIALQAEIREAGSGSALTTTAADYERQVLGKLADWRTVLRQVASEALSILRQLIVDRLALTPTEANGTRQYRYRGQFTIGGLFEGLLGCPRALASPTGLISWGGVLRLAA